MDEPVQVRDLAPIQPTIQVAAQGESEPDERALPLSHYLWVLKWHRWKILAFVGLATGATWFVCSRLTPLYQATTTVDIDRQMPRGGLGDSMTSSIVSPMDADQFLATQTSLIQSDSVLRPVVEKFSLRPKLPPKTSPERAAELRNEPIVLPDLTVSRPPNTYLLEIRYRSPNRQLAADVTNAIADSYLDHLFRIRTESSGRIGIWMADQLTQLKARMESSSQRLASFERELSVINPEQKTSIQSASLLQLNTEYNTAKDERVRKEAAYNAIRAGTLNAALASSQSDSLKKLSEDLAAARQRLAMAKTHYGERHPEYARAQAELTEVQNEIAETKDSIMDRVSIEYRQAVDREKMLSDQVAQTRADFDRLNARSFDYQALREEADADKKLYDELVRHVREANINASFQDGSIRIADRARPAANPVFPRTWTSVLIALILSLAVSTGTVILNDLIDNTIRDPEEISRSLRVEIVGTLPAVRGLRARPGSPIAPEKPISPGSRHEKFAVYDEAVRTLRNSMLLTDFNSRLRSVLVTSASPAEGKSTVAASLALAHAEHGSRTLLIDCDLRRPSIDRILGLPNDKGLASVLMSCVPWRDAIVETGHHRNLHVLPAGFMPRRSASLASGGLPKILDEVSAEYDLVIVDSPPLIGFPEPLQMAVNVDGVLVVTRAGHTNRKGLSAVLAILRRLQANVVGLVLNEVKPNMSDSYYYHQYYSRYYRKPRPAEVS